ncbi:hypothetical protein [Roseibium aggregatum]|uniref:Uncharacterized protein n=1 Tax=Roseibium aggregatum TaxID=187304 RepID=A0A939J2W0_9HYPH|nr:hypothetical protein [Roseibium aggregatum]MBN9671833.1 hypothetical protein [Roseibium aggregatum]
MRRRENRGLGQIRNAAFALCGLLACLSPAQPVAAPLEVITRKPEGAADTRNLYVESLLSQALEKAEVNASILQAKTPFTRDRLLQELIAGENIHVTADSPKPGWEENLLTVRIPLRKGIQGYRLFLINKQDQADLAQVDTLEELKKIPTGSGAQWSITRTLKDAGFNLVTTEDYETLFDMLEYRRFITFGRGINEAFREQENFSKRNPNLVVEQSLCLFIPLPTYFFVSPKHPELAEKIETGLERMIEDGSFDAHFLLFHGDDIERAQLSERKVFKVPNTDLGDAYELGDPSYWYDPKAFEKDRTENRS